MKLVILTPYTKKADITNDTKPFVDFCEKKGHKTNIVSTATPQAGDEEGAISVSNEIKNADAVIVTSSISGIELGGCISLALQHRKSTLLFYTKSKPESVLFGSSNLITMEKWNDKAAKNLNEIMKPFFSDTKKKKLLYRFNLMLSREMNIYLSRKSRDTGVSKADYVRQLISYDMRNDKDNG
ncbi:MAG: hypothetical protein ACOCXQ_01340 [Patescibacteria group bacterium]